MTTVICQGCGQAFEVPEGYVRNKIQCTGCGVICPVPAEGQQQAAGKRASAREAARPQPATVEDEAAAWLKDSEPAPAPLLEQEPVQARQEPTPPSEPAAPARKPAEKLFPCRRCGQLVRRQRECPACDREEEGTLPEDPEQARPKKSRADPLVGLTPHSLELDEPEPETMNLAEEDDEEPDPYVLADPDLPRCPRCRKDMNLGAVVCLSCGFNLRTRKKAARSYQPIARSWESDMTLKTRLMWLGAFQAFHLFLTVIAALNGHATPFLVSWLPLTVILSFVLGTYDCIDLMRDARGRVTVTKRWRVLFVPVAPQVSEVRGYGGVVMGQWNDAGFFEWMIFIVLLCVGLIPAFIWWYNAIHKNSYHVALAIDHGHAELYVYRGRSEEQMNEIAAVLCDATGLRNIS